MKSVAAFILAGGRSLRMGTDKAFLELAGKPLIVRAVEVALKALPEVKIVGDPRKFAAFGPVIEDVYRDRGPLGGIHAALTNSAAEWNAPCIARHLSVSQNDLCREVRTRLINSSPRLQSARFRKRR
jgi:molybdopterin-guanine dinucleotide biosynthesis protein A